MTGQLTFAKYLRPSGNTSVSTVIKKPIHDILIPVVNASTTGVNIPLKCFLQNLRFAAVLAEWFIILGSCISHVFFYSRLLQAGDVDQYLFTWRKIGAMKHLLWKTTCKESCGLYDEVQSFLVF